MTTKTIIKRYIDDAPNDNPPTTGWMNCRTATRMTIDEDDTHYIIRTTVPYLDMMSADFRIEQRNLFIRGQVNNPDGSSYQGMYVRHLDLSEEIDPNHLEARFDLRGRVTLYLHKVDIVDSVDGQKVVDCPELP